MASSWVINAQAALVAEFKFDSNIYSTGNITNQGNSSEIADTLTDPDSTYVWADLAPDDADAQIVANPSSQQILSGNQVLLLPGTGNGDNHRDLIDDFSTAFPSFRATRGFGSFLFNVGSIPTGIERFLFHARATGSDARLSFGLQPFGAGYNLGVDNRALFDNGSGFRTFLSPTLLTGVWYSVAFEVEDNLVSGSGTEELRVWLNPSGLGDEASPTVNLTGIANTLLIDQMESVNLDVDTGFVMYLDNLRYGTTFADAFQPQPAFIPEPSSLLFALGSLGLLALRRRK
jgi:hypothetical protein